MGRQLSKRFPACATYWGRISIGMPTKPSLFGRPDDLLEKHSEQINTVGRDR
jgi:hypothetical protein